MRRSGIVAGPRDDDVVRHREQTFPLTPRRDLRPRVSTHYEKKLSRVAQRSLKTLDRVHRVTSIRSIELKRRDQQPRIILRGEGQHCITMYRLRYRPPDFVRRHLRRNEKNFLNLK